MDSWHKLKWSLCKEGDVNKFRAEIKGHTSSLNILLATIQLETMTLNSQKSNVRHTSLVDAIQEQSRNIMGHLNTIIATGEDHAEQGKALLEVTAQILQSNLDVFRVVHNIQLCIFESPGQIMRQPPVYLTDALNKECPFHLEFVRSWAGLMAVLKDNLRETGCGPDMIDRGQFVIEEQGTRRTIDFTVPWEICVHPGQRLAMSMVFKGQGQIHPTCPRCGTGCEQSIQETTW
jgi:hypothetical protein